MIVVLHLVHVVLWGLLSRVDIAIVGVDDEFLICEIWLIGLPSRREASQYSDFKGVNATQR